MRPTARAPRVSLRKAPGLPKFAGIRAAKSFENVVLILLPVFVFQNTIIGPVVENDRLAFLFET